MFSSIQSSLPLVTFTIQCMHFRAVTRPCSDHFHTDAVVSSSDHCRTDAVVPPSDHYCIETVAPSGDHYCLDIVAVSRRNGVKVLRYTIEYFFPVLVV